MPQTSGLTYEQALKIGYKPKSDGLTLEQAQAVGFKPAEPSQSLVASRAAASRGEFEDVNRQSTAGTRLRESLIGVLEPFDLHNVPGLVNAIGKTFRDVNADATNVRDLEAINQEGQRNATEIGKGIVMTPINPVKNFVQGVAEGDYDKAAYGSGGMLSQTAPAVAGTAEMVAGGVNAAKAAVTNTAAKAADVLEESATKNYKTILDPTTKETKFVTQKVAPELAKRGVTAMTESRLKLKVGKAKMEAGAAIEKAWNRVADGDTFTKQPILDAIDGVKREFTVDNVEVLPSAIAKLDELRGIVDELGDEISPASLRKTRQILDKAIDDSKGFGGKDLKASSEIYAQKQVANILRSQISEKFPNIAQLNAEFKFWADVDDVLAAKTLRETNKSVTMRDLISGNAGAGTGAAIGASVAGAPGAVIGSAVGGLSGAALLRFMQSTAWRTLKAQSKLKIASFIEKGQFAEAAKMIPPSHQLTEGARPMPAPDLSGVTGVPASAAPATQQVRTGRLLNAGNPLAVPDNSGVTGVPAIAAPATQQVRTGRLLTAGKPLPAPTELPSGGFEMTVESPGRPPMNAYEELMQRKAPKK